MSYATAKSYPDICPHCGVHIEDTHKQDCPDSIQACGRRLGEEFRLRWNAEFERRMSALCRAKIQSKIVKIKPLT